ncbi:MAG: FeoB-associated Cys-rich membrane protein [Thermomicrobiales bacterium]|nr:FeoB-associated Cys-rich membrane protein [Thermomicrobiales bacterium]
MIATVVISAMLIVIVGMIVRSMVLKARSGQSVGCGGCSGCSVASCCSRAEKDSAQIIQIQMPRQRQRS